MIQIKKTWWRNRTNQALLVFLAIAAYFLWAEHRAHVVAALPWLLVGACLVMHLFMHGGHGHRGRANGGDNEDGQGDDPGDTRP